jgi:uncharacterized protein
VKILNPERYSVNFHNCAFKKNNSLIIKSGKENYYIYDKNINTTFFVNPILVYLSQLDDKGINIEGWIKNIKNSYILFDKYKVNKDKLNYYYKKYLLFKSNGFFSTSSKIDLDLKLKIEPEEIRRTLANIKQITFEVTEKCNLNCEYCGYGKYYQDYDERQNKDLDINISKKVIEYFVELLNSPLNTSHNKFITIGFYGGEPLLCFPFIKKIVAFVNSLHLLHNKFRFAITTNGILIKKYINFLVENNFSLLISLDGNEKNNEYRVYKNGKPAFDTILENVNSLKTNYPLYFKNYVNFNAVLHNKNSVFDIYNFFKYKFNKIPSISELNTTRINPQLKENFLKLYSKITKSLYNSEDYSTIEREMFIKLPMLMNLTMFLHVYNYFVFKNYNSLLSLGIKEIEMPTGTCFPFSKKVFITVNGKILPCERVGHQYALGLVDSKKVELDLEKIARKYNSYFKKILIQCNTCTNYKSCLQCIFHLELNKKNPKCPSFMNSNQFLEYFSYFITYLEKTPEIYYRIMKEVVIV